MSSSTGSSEPLTARPEVLLSHLAGLHPSHSYEPARRFDFGYLYILTTQIGYCLISDLIYAWCQQFGHYFAANGSRAFILEVSTAPGLMLWPDKLNFVLGFKEARLWQIKPTDLGE